ATTVARRNLANAVATITSEELNRTPSESVDKALQGKIAGANITANSGAPGGGVQLNLRGVSSINGASEPLYVIDGVIVSNVAIPSGANAVTRASGGSNASNQDAPVNRIADLNPNDIETIEILKGPSAAAIYGSKASNGVVLITTKSGRGGVTRINARQSFGVYDLSNTLGTRNFTRGEAIEVFGLDAAAADRFFNADGTPRNRVSLEEELAGRNDLSTETSVSISGGSEDTRYFASGLVQNDEGIIRNTGFEKQSLRLNLDQRLGSRVQVGLNTNVIHTLAQRGLSNNDNTGTSYYIALSSTPGFIDLRAQDGAFPINPFAFSNPLQTAALVENDEDVWRFIASGNATVDILANDRQTLKLSATGGADYFDQQNELFFPPSLQFEQPGFDADPFPGTSLLSNSDNLNLNGNVNLVHVWSPGSYTATTSAGVQYEDRDLNIARNIGRNLVGGQRNIDAATNIEVFQTRQRVRDFGVYLQEEVLLLDSRLLLTGSVRADRSSANGDSDEYLLYPKAAASYVIPGFAPRLDQLKLRAAYGETGNQPLFGQQFTPLSATNNIQGLPGLVVIGTAGDPDIQPERSREIEGGFDATLFNGNAQLEFTAYQQTITDLLLTRTLAPSTGFFSQIFNGGELRTRGIEAALSATPVRRGGFSWTSRTTFYTTKSTIEELPVPAFQTGGFGTALGSFRIEEGESATQIVARIAEGDSSVVRQVGDATPEFKMGFTNEFAVGPFTLSGLVDWQKGGTLINLTKLLFDFGQVTEDFAADPRFVTNIGPRVINDTLTAGQRRVRGFGVETRPYIEDGGFVKLRELSLAYNLPPTVVNRVVGGVRSAQLALSGRNLITWTDYTGLDPEVSNFGNQPIARNIDVAPFPPSRSFWLSVNLGF
ncbi:MAG: SusC/RagA family TonB-linked outer membrane protein, partial [Gemmatimonadota bacterium]|nr:SusC/RagA family TonB-linked outer membrane protein [Gemmatimonadota bacterium]